MNPCSVKLFLIEGSANGLRTAEIGNWTGKALAASRDQLSSLRRREETERTGVYILIGEAPDSPSGVGVYIGEGDQIWPRLVKHNKDPEKSFWTDVICIVSKDDSLTKAHARWLEARFVSDFKEEPSCTLYNSNLPTGGTLPEADEADMNAFYANAALLLPLLGLPVHLHTSTRPVVPSHQRLDASIVELELRAKDAEAQCRVVDGQFIVQAGSTVVKRASSKLTSAPKENRKWLRRQGLLANHPNNADLYRLQKNVPFTSASRAASVVAGVDTNGKTKWRVKGSNVSYAAWLESQTCEE